MESEPIALFEDETEIRKVSCGRSHSAFLDSGDCAVLLSLKLLVTIGSTTSHYI